MSEPFGPILISHLGQVKSFANSILPYLKPGAVLGISGELGAGKTELTKSLLLGLGHKGIVSSPSYVLENRYEIDCSSTKLREVLHYDFYRLSGPLDELGVGEIVPSDDQIAIIEWPEKAEGLEDLLSFHIKLEFLASNEGSENDIDKRNAFLVKGFSSEDYLNIIKTVHV